MTHSSDADAPILVLWDIDRTLLISRGVGNAAFATAFEQVTGLALAHMPPATGRTDIEIYAAALEMNNVAQAPAFSEFAAAFEKDYAGRQAELRGTGVLMPGAADALRDLAEDPGIHQSVLTGNTRPIARMKLETFGLDAHLDLEAGAYGDDDGHRPALVPLAQARASARFGAGFGPHNTVLIGDSPGDIRAALEGGARVIAVAAGGADPRSLVDAHAVLADLTDTRALSDTIRSITKYIGTQDG